MAYAIGPVSVTGTLQPHQLHDLFRAVASLNSGEVSLKVRGGRLVAMTVRSQTRAA